MNSERATDASANERTYLAYIRTALSFIAFGFVVARFSLFVREIAQVTHSPIPAHQLSLTFGIAMALIGVAVAIFGSVRYAATERALREGRVDPLSVRIAHGLAISIALIGAVIAFELFGYR
ncbi:MAG: DUF202 domain-containing protein [Candidatus Eremiobacteraeota bacterium]|nr:DUF202 domain-containing protein [Candidatus Eremiobacteraeota bacterium]